MALFPELAGPGGTLLATILVNPAPGQGGHARINAQWAHSLTSFAFFVFNDAPSVSHHTFS